MQNASTCYLTLGYKGVDAWLNGSFLAHKSSIQIHNKFLKSGQMDMVVIFKIFNIVIFDYQMFTNL
jgi:hypothetical protein